MSIEHFYPVTEVWYFHFILDQLDLFPWLDKTERIGWRKYKKRPTVFYYRTQLKIYSSFPGSKEVNYDYIRNYYLAERHFIPISYPDLYDLLPS